MKLFRSWIYYYVNYWSCRLSSCLMKLKNHLHFDVNTRFEVYMLLVSCILSAGVDKLKVPPADSVGVQKAPLAPLVPSTLTQGPRWDMLVKGLKLPRPEKKGTSFFRDEPTVRAQLSLPPATPDWAAAWGMGRACSVFGWDPTFIISHGGQFHLLLLGLSYLYWYLCVKNKLLDPFLKLKSRPKSHKNTKAGLKESAWENPTPAGPVPTR